MNRAVFLLLLLLLSPWPGIGFAAGPAPLVLNTTFDAPIISPDKSGFLDLLYAELFGRLGIPFEIQPLPAERALQNANAGIDDGDVGRIADLAETYPNLVHSGEPVLQYQMVVFTRKENFPVTGVESLLGHEVGIVTGWKVLERATRQHHSRTMVDSTEQLFLMLDQDRIDIAIVDQSLGVEAVRRLGLQGVRILSPPLLVGDWYLYLHNKHKSLIPRIDEELRKMKQDGTYECIRRQVSGRYPGFDPQAGAGVNGKEGRP